MTRHALDILTIAVASAVATSHLFLAAMGFLVGRHHRAVNHFFSFALVAAAWWAVWAGLWHIGVHASSPRLWGMSQLASGFVQPALLLFTWSVTRPDKPLPRGAYAILLAGSFGFAFGFILLVSPEFAAEQQARLSAGGTFAVSPVLVTLYALHSLESFTLALANATLLAIAAVRASDPEIRANARSVLLAMVGSVIAIFLTNVLAPLSGQHGVARFAPVFSLLAAFVAYRVLVGSKQQMERLRAERDRLVPYVPEPVLDDLAAPTLGGREAEVTVMFSDIRGFTSLSQELAPAAVVQFINRYLAEMNEAATAHHGVIDKFMGDAVLFVFGLRDPSRNHALDGLECAEDMLRRLDRFNQTWISEGHEPIRIGIGLATGHAVHGNIGTATRMEYTVMGDVVNTASRIEALTKELDVPLLVAESSHDMLPEAARRRLTPIGQRKLRGRAQETTLYGLVRVEGAGTRRHARSP